MRLLLLAISSCCFGQTFGVQLGVGLPVSGFKGVEYPFRYGWVESYTNRYLGGVFGEIELGQSIRNRARLSIPPNPFFWMDASCRHTSRTHGECRRWSVGVSILWEVPICSWIDDALRRGRTSAQADGDFR
jgi:hypothetical protein